LKPSAAISRSAGSGQSILAWQLAFGVLAVATWEVAGRTFGSAWSSLPSLVLRRLITWGEGDLFMHISVTMTELSIGFALGTVAGMLAGMTLGRMETLALVLRPVIVALYSVPLITMAPLLILWFGLEMESKIVLVTIVVFFLVFFNTFAGVRTIDPSLIVTLQLMGSTRREEFQRIIAPASMAWILSGIKIAFPYALAATTTGELLGGNRGLGTLLSRAATQFDMTGLYAALIVLLVIGIVFGEVIAFIERYLLRWRNVAE
jgi:NitT/TauT family transport system permease protein